MRLKRRLWEVASRISGLSDEQREQAREFVVVDKYSLAWEYIADRLIENEAQISSEDYAELRDLGERIQFFDKRGVRQLDDYLGSLGDLARGGQTRS